MTPRELILERLVSSISAIAPGMTYTFPRGLPHAAIVTDLSGRVHLRQEPAAKLDATQLPAVVVVADTLSPETYEPTDRGLYFAKMAISVLGYDRADDAGDSLDSVLRPKLNALRSDLIIACHAAPYWPLPSSEEALVHRIGTGFVLLLTAQWADPTIESSIGACAVELTASYPVNAHQRH